MAALEPTSTALVLASLGVLLLASVLLSRASERFGVPVALIFLAIGIAAGSEGLGGIAFDDPGLAFRAGTAALVVILFDGGLNTSAASLREGIRPAALLATVGVVATAAVVGLGARVCGFGWTEAMLLGAIVSSTDAAAVFSILRGSGLHLKRRVATTLELESGLNDPMAVILTAALTAVLATGRPLGASLLLGIPVALAVGAAAGLLVGAVGRRLLARLRLPAGGLYPVLTLALALLAFGLPTLVAGSGFLAVYVAALVLGNGPLPYRAGVLRVHDALAWFAQIAMFLLLGLLVFPSRLWAVAPTGLALGLFLAFVARPLVVLACLAPFRYPMRETLYVGWIGLRGAVPIILATFPILSGAPGAARIFDVVFFIVVVNALVPGGTVRWATRALGLEARVPPAPQAVLEITSMQPLQGELLSFYIEPASAVSGSTIAELPVPEGAAVTLIVRGKELIAPRGATVIKPGDHVYVFCRPEDRALVYLLFGRPEV